jgi:hypothetical protein
VGSAGHIRIFDAAQPTTAVADVDMAAPVIQGEIAGRGFDSEGNRPTNLQIPLIRR